MTQIQTSDGYFTSTVDIEHLDEVKKDCGSTELIAYSVDESEEEVTVVIDVSEIDSKLRYIY